MGKVSKVSQVARVSRVNRRDTDEGVSLIEILVVTTIFAILGIITTRSVLLTLQGSKKTESVVRVRENLNYALSVVERNLRNANGVSQCPNPDPLSLVYTSAQGSSTSFSCVNLGSNNGYIASGSASLTSSSINVTACQFTCTQSGGGANPPSVTVSFGAKDKSTAGIEGAEVTVTNKIYLRNY